MHYTSTRGDTTPMSFEDVLLRGLAPDGGLYWPQEWPNFTPDEITAMQGLPYAEVACRLLAPFVGDDVSNIELHQCVEAAYGRFRHQAVAPLVELSEQMWLLELFHGPTLAFKDIAMQLLGPLFDLALKKRGQRLTIVGATSGDTGSAAIDAMRGRQAVDIFILHPHNRTSEIQRRQMTTITDDNVHNIAIQGTFDDCQALVKDMFTDEKFRTRIHMSGVNSINWARIMAQAVYYFTSAVALGAPARTISFAVPTGNFGDILAGFVAKKMGLPVEKLIIATNANDILVRTLKTGRYKTDRVQPSLSPAMDIQVSSNFERLLFELYDRDATAISRLMQGLKQSGAFTVDAGVMKKLKSEFEAFRVDDRAIEEQIAQTYRTCAAIIDPHTAVGIAAARHFLSRHPGPVVSLATASPAKFPDAVVAATGRKPELPDDLADLFDRDECYDILPNDLGQVKDFIEQRARAAR